MHLSEVQGMSQKLSFSLTESPPSLSLISQILVSIGCDPSDYEQKRRECFLKVLATAQSVLLARFSKVLWAISGFGLFLRDVVRKKVAASLEISFPAPGKTIIFIWI